eukprot:727909-Rhodomonas_salina.2
MPVRPPRARPQGTAMRRMSIEADETVVEAPPHALPTGQRRLERGAPSKPKLLPSYRGARRGSMEIGESLFAPAPVLFLKGLGGRGGRRRSVEISMGDAAALQGWADPADVDVDEREEHTVRDDDQEPRLRSEASAAGGDDAATFVSDLEGWMDKEDSPNSDGPTWRR